MSPGDNCRSGCATRDHTSFGDCLKAANLRIGYCRSAAGWDATREKAFQRENERYAQALRDGLQPNGVLNAQIDRAYRAAEQRS